MVTRLTHLYGRTLVVLCVACAPYGREALRGRPDAPAGDGDVSLDGGDCGRIPDEPEESALPVPAADPALSGASHAYFVITVRDQDGAVLPGVKVRTLNHVARTTDDSGRIAFYEPGLMNGDVFFVPTREGYEHAADELGARGRALRADEGGAGELVLTKIGESPAPPASTLESERIALGVPRARDCFGLRVIDRVTRAGVPLVFLRTDTEEFVTDSQGMVAYCPPAPFARAVRFQVESHGYAFTAGTLELVPEAGKAATIELTRIQVAERLYRDTGQGLYRDSVMLGLTTPITRPLLNGRVISQDAVASVVHDGRVLFVWGNTDRPDYFIGSFAGTAAWARLDAGDPRSGIELDYLTREDGFARELAPGIEPSNLQTWLSPVVSALDARGNPTLYAVFAKPNPDLTTARRGLLRFDETSERFVDTNVDFATDGVRPRGQPLEVRHATGSSLYFDDLRVPKEPGAMLDPGRYQSFPDLPASSQSVRDVETGVSLAVSGDPAQIDSERLGRFVRIVQQRGGTTSFLGELWALYGDTPLGPFVYGKKVVSHDAQSFFAPWFHPHLTSGTGRFVYFEGSYSHVLAGDVEITPRYERNQIMYRLDLDDARLSLPVPVYEPSPGHFAVKGELRPGASAMAVRFFAPDRPAPGLVGMGFDGASCAPRRLRASPPVTPSFYAFPAGEEPSGAIVPLYEHVAAGRFSYGLAPESDADMVVAYVWPNPLTGVYPVGEFLGERQADAGPDQCLAETTPFEGADVTLDASGSRHLRDAFRSYLWRDLATGCVVAEGQTARVTLPAGLHELELEARDAEGRHDRDRVLVSITPDPRTPK